LAPKAARRNKQGKGRGSEAREWLEDACLTIHVTIDFRDLHTKQLNLGLDGFLRHTEDFMILSGLSRERKRG
jgi:hypothetical protein